jgi:hypothetical protein
LVGRCGDNNECTDGTVHGCSHQCVNTDGGFLCACNSTGYRLLADGKACEDINECSEKTDNCQQQCVNNDGGFECACFQGYLLSAKGEYSLVKPVSVRVDFICTVHVGYRNSHKRKLVYSEHNFFPAAKHLCFVKLGYKKTHI